MAQPAHDFDGGVRRSVPKLTVDEQRIADAVIASIRDELMPINDNLKSIDKRLESIEQEMKGVHKIFAANGFIVPDLDD